MTVIPALKELKREAGELRVGGQPGLNSENLPKEKQKVMGSIGKQKYRIHWNTNQP
jgi:hypothetical protein